MKNNEIRKMSDNDTTADTLIYEARDLLDQAYETSDKTAQKALRAEAIQKITRAMKLDPEQTRLLAKLLKR